MTRTTIRRRTRGFSTLDYILATGLILIALPTIAALNNKTIQDDLDAVTARQLAQLCQGANSYEIANFATLLAQTAAQPTTVPIATLQAQGYISPNFNAIGPSAQTYRLVIAQPAPNEIHPLIVSTGGTPLNELRAANIALAAGYAGGGYISNLDPTNLRGARATYGPIPLATFNAPGVTLTPGHVACDSFYSANNTLSPFLNRFNTGVPEANTMHANIDVNQHELTNTRDVLLSSTTSTGRRLSQSLQNSDITANGSVVPQPSCPTDSYPRSIRNPPKSRATPMATCSRTFRLSPPTTAMEPGLST